MLVLSFQTSFFFCLLVRFVILLLLLLKAGQEVFGKRNWTGSHKDLCSWVTVLVSCFSLCLPIDSHLPYDLSSLMETRKVTDSPFVQLFSYMNESDDSQVSYTPDQKLEVWFRCFCVLPSFLPFPPHTFYSIFPPFLPPTVGPLHPLPSARLCQSGHRANNCSVTLLFTFSGILGRWHPWVATCPLWVPGHESCCSRVSQIQKGLPSLNLAALYFFGTY